MTLLQRFIQNAKSSGITMDISTFENTPCNIYCIDRCGKITDCNETEAKTFNFSKPEEMYGLTSFDFASEDIASCYQAHNEQVFKSQIPNISIEPVLLPNGNKINFISYKVPFRNLSNKPLGIIGLSFSINHEWLPDVGCATSDPNSGENTTKLTPRQAACLYYLVKGMTIKQIAHQMLRSPRTVEHYLETIKAKLNCHSRSQLISKAITFPFIMQKLNSRLM